MVQVGVLRQSGIMILYDCFDALESGFLNEARRLASENALVRVLVDLWREVPSQQYVGTHLAAGSSSRMVDVSTVMRRIQVSNSL